MDDIRLSAAMAPATINGTLENAVVCSNEYRNSWVGGEPVVICDVNMKCAEEPPNVTSSLSHHLSQSKFRLRSISDTKSPTPAPSTGDIGFSHQNVHAVTVLNYNDDTNVLLCKSINDKTVHPLTERDVSTGSKGWSVRFSKG